MRARRSSCFTETCTRLTKLERQWFPLIAPCCLKDAGLKGLRANVLAQAKDVDRADAAVVPGERGYLEVLFGEYTRILQGLHDSSESAEWRLKRHGITAT